MRRERDVIDTFAAEPDRSPSVEPFSASVAASADAASDSDLDPLPLPASKPDPDPAPADLARGADALVPRFPLEQPGTWLVLYQSAPGELRARWSLARTDMERFGSGFAVNGTRPAPVLRLRRSRPEGGTELADEVSLIRVARERSGDAGFRVGPGLALYHAELGLAAADGGWLMLARSNRLDNAARIGLRLPVSQERSPILEPIGLLPRFPLVEPVQGQPVAASGGTTRRLGDRNALTVEGRGLSLESPAWGPTGDTAPTPPHQPSQTLSIGRALCLDPPPLPSAAMALADSVSIDMLAYEAAPTRTNGLRMDAELRILGAAAPGSLIDLFGHSFQVGPGGRFQLTVRVDDPDLLRRALELHPPPELKAKRDD